MKKIKLTKNLKLVILSKINSNFHNLEELTGSDYTKLRKMITEISEEWKEEDGGSKMTKVILNNIGEVVENKLEKIMFSKEYSIDNLKKTFKNKMKIYKRMKKTKNGKVCPDYKKIKKEIRNIKYKMEQMRKKN